MVCKCQWAERVILTPLPGLGDVRRTASASLDFCITRFQKGGRASENRLKICGF